MSKIIVIALLGALTACSSPNHEVPNVKLVMDNPTLQKMSRMEVIAAIDDCRSAKLRAILIYSKVRINNQLTPVVVDVTCGISYN